MNESVGRWYDHIFMPHGGTFSDWSLPSHWDEQAKRNGRPSRVFYMAYGTLFQSDEASRNELWKTIDGTPDLRWLIPISDALAVRHLPRILPSNLWPGAFVRSQYDVNALLPVLCGVPAVQRFMIYGPAQEPVNVLPWLHGVGGGRITWVIADRLYTPHLVTAYYEWAAALRAQCRAAGVCFFPDDSP